MVGGRDSALLLACHCHSACVRHLELARMGVGVGGGLVIDHPVEPPEITFEGTEFLVEVS